MHTQDAPAALQRLLEIGIPAFQVNSAVTGIVAQRLLRRICPDCREAYTPPAWVSETIGAGQDTQFFHGKGCEKCGQTGYRGRLAIYELLPLTDPLRLALARDEGVDELRRLALAAGHQTLRAAGLAKAAAGLTTLDEVLKVCG